MTALTLFILCIIGATLALIGLVLILACIGSAQFHGDIVDDGKDWP